MDAVEMTAFGDSSPNIYFNILFYIIYFLPNITIYIAGQVNISIYSSQPPNLANPTPTRQRIPLFWLRRRFGDDGYTYQLDVMIA